MLKDLESKKIYPVVIDALYKGKSFIIVEEFVAGHSLTEKLLKEDLAINPLCLIAILNQLKNTIV